MGWSLTVANASGSERCVFLPWLILLLILPSVANSSAYSSFRVYASVFSVFFRVNPWQILLLGLLLPSVANLLPFTHHH